MNDVVTKSQPNTANTIDPHIPMQELIARHPQIVDVLIVDYDFHCLRCFMSEFETLAEGAVVHGIEGEDYDQMLEHLNSIINSPATSQTQSPESN